MPELLHHLKTVSSEARKGFFFEVISTRRPPVPPISML